MSFSRRDFRALPHRQTAFQALSATILAHDWNEAPLVKDKHVLARLARGVGAAHADLPREPRAAAASVVKTFAASLDTVSPRVGREQLVQLGSPLLEAGLLPHDYEGLTRAEMLALYRALANSLEEALQARHPAVAPGRKGCKCTK